MGGAETALIELLASVRSAEPDWELWLILGEDGPLTERASRLGVQVRVAAFPKTLARLGDAGGRGKAMAWGLIQAAFGIAGYRRRLKALLREIRPDLIHTNGFKMHLLGAWSCPAGTPLIWHVHDYIRSRRMMSRIMQRNSSRCAAVLVNSKSVARDVQALLPKHRVVVLYNSVDLNRFAPAGDRLDLDTLSQLPAAADGAIRVGLVGTFAKWKGHKVFLQALSKLPKTVAVRGYVIGGPIYQTQGSQWTVEELKAEASRLGLEGRVGFTGKVENPAAAMRGLDIVVHASTEPEPFGMVIIEGMACAKPVIVSQAGGAVELFEEGRTALGCPPGDAEALARQIGTLAEDAELRERLGKAARVAIASTFARNHLSDVLINLYRVNAGSARETALQLQ